MVFPQINAQNGFIVTRMIRRTTPASVQKLQFSEHDCVENICRIDIKSELDIDSAKISLAIENQKISSTLMP